MNKRDKINKVFEKWFGENYSIGPPFESISFDNGKKFIDETHQIKGGLYQTPNGLIFMAKWRIVNSPSDPPDLDLGCGKWVGPCSTEFHLRYLIVEYWVFLTNDFFSQ